MRCLQKMQEQALQQLNEQLQMNILQQSQLLQTATTAGDKVGKAGSKAQHQQLQQLAVQQQQLVQQINQIHLHMRQYLLAASLPFGLPQGEMFFVLFACLFVLFVSLFVPRSPPPAQYHQQNQARWLCVSWALNTSK